MIALVLINAESVIELGAESNQLQQQILRNTYSEKLLKAINFKIT